MDEKWLTVEEIAAHLRISKDTVYNWIKEREMPAHRVGRKWMFQQVEVDDWVKFGAAASSPDDAGSV